MTAPFAEQASFLRVVMRSAPSFAHWIQGTIHPQLRGSGSKIRRMDAISDAREAKEFLISKIVAEAQRENVALSEIERKMLYFAETGWTLPDIMQVNDSSTASTTRTNMKGRWRKSSPTCTEVFFAILVTNTRSGRPPCGLCGERITTS